MAVYHFLNQFLPYFYHTNLFKSLNKELVKQDFYAYSTLAFYRPYEHLLR
jgi:hypothetical protein